jgi:hypothetical protein
MSVGATAYQLRLGVRALSQHIIGGRLRMHALAIRAAVTIGSHGWLRQGQCGV